MVSLNFSDVKVVGKAARLSVALDPLESGVLSADVESRVCHRRELHGAAVPNEVPIRVIGRVRPRLSAGGVSAIR